MYDPLAHRFAGRDVARSGRNWYGYVGGNPATKVDPTGLREDDSDLLIEPVTAPRLPVGAGDQFEDAFLPQPQPVDNNQLRNGDYSQKLEMSTGLRQGSVGEEVIRLQKKLISSGWWRAARNAGLVNVTPGSNGTNFGYFGEATERVVNYFKDSVMPEGNKGANRGVVGATTWEYLNDVSNSKRMVDGELEILSDYRATKEFKMGENLAKNLLSLFFTVVQTVPFYMDNSLYRSWSYASFSYGGNYFEALKCSITREESAALLAKGIEIANTTLSSFDQMAKATGGEPLTTVGGTILLTLATELFSAEPGMYEFYQHTLGVLTNEASKKAAENLNKVSMSYLSYVLKYNPNLYKVREMYNKQLSAYIESLKSWDFEEEVDRWNKIQSSAIEYLQKVIDANNNPDGAKQAVNSLFL